ncbi:MAG: GntR family transcriptional regulator [Gammaproteobacteria bacterium]|nr:GntR family transcriptional regulator [Gammaproteobacteria bacterium]
MNDAISDLPAIVGLGQPVSDRIAALLQTAILDGRYRPGHWLREVDLATQLGVSRTPLREAFYILERKGLLQIFPRRGARVKTITPTEMEWLLTIRACLDGLATSLAARNTSPEHLKRLKEILSAQQRASKAKDSQAFHRLGQQFHALIYEACGNRKLISIYQSLSIEGALYPISDNLIPGEKELSLRDHGQLLKAIAAADEKHARRYAETHIERVKTRLQKSLASQRRNTPQK